MYHYINGLNKGSRKNKVDDAGTSQIGFGRNEEWQHLSQAAFAEEWDKPENAYWDVHLTNPSRMDNHVQDEEPLTPIPEKEQAEQRVQQMENIIAPLREPLPKDYKFDRDKANER